MVKALSYFLWGKRKLKAYKQLLDKNEEYLFEGLHQREPDDMAKL